MHTFFHMTFATKVVEHTLHFRRQFRRQFVAVIAGTTTGIIHIIVVTVGAGLFVVVDVLKGDRQQRTLQHRCLPPRKAGISEHN